VIQVTDQSGRVVSEARPTLTAGATSTWSWDGRDSNGRQLADGSYGFTIQGRDSNGAMVAISAGVLARPTGVERGADGVSLRFGPLALGYDKLRSVQP
jgi:flagellar basal-body rod modification protein FlgD